ncbi:uncharacterized protein I206_105078 [Kwoniella pini CBS 10737]|uniref:Uncharacterized protein n=1 Tax=Kwoniella pini CBS 10737 TaxID=1296096 RepID=A0A1B9I8H9_9TREE|nr:uncharacterized protein I206_02618 [Kwoniella pini CBS 10737]OCF51902.1 hypothetical protein I206_02618 [Kwoniella pini CBS 10737]
MSPPKLLFRSPTPSPDVGTEVEGKTILDEEGISKSVCPNSPGLVWKKKEILESSGHGIGGSRKMGVGKGKAGWQDLPVNILHLILSHASNHELPPNCLNIAWNGRPRSQEIIQALQQRIELCELRKICFKWKNAVDSHPFWPAFTLLLDPSRPHCSTLDDIHSASLIPSTPSFPTLFHRARFTTLHVCLACRLNHPCRIGLYPAVKRRITYTQRLGYAPTCEKHYLHTCSSCMREFGIESLSPIGNQRRWILNTPSPTDGGVPIDKGLIPSNRGDIDEEGHRRYKDVLICKACRFMAISNELSRALVSCARGSQVRGLNEDWTTSEHIVEYIERSIDTVPIQVERALEVRWLVGHTRYIELIATAQELQNIEQTMKMEFITNGIVENEYAKNYRLQLEYELRGEDYKEIESSQDKIEKVNMYNSWQHQLQAKRRRREKTSMHHLRSTAQGRWVLNIMPDGFDHDDEEEEEEEVEEIGKNGLNGKWETKLQAGCVNDWLNDRIRFGFWVSPSDEVGQHSISNRPEIPSFHTSFRDISLNTQHPFAKYFDIDYDSSNAQEDSAGLMNLDPPITRVDPFLPPQRLLESLDKLYEEKLRRQLHFPLKRLVDSIKNWFEGDEEQAERYCSSLAIHKIVEQLNSWELWTPTNVLEEMKRSVNGPSHSEGPSMAPGTAGPQHQQQQKQEKLPSPKIELVQDEYKSPTLADYGIRKIEFAVPGENEFYEAGEVAQPQLAKEKNQSPNLGKRKALNDGADELSIADLPKKTRHSPAHERSVPLSVSSGLAAITTNTMDLGVQSTGSPNSPEEIIRTATDNPKSSSATAMNEQYVPPKAVHTNPIFDSASPSVYSSTADGTLIPEEEDADDALFERSETEASSHDTLGTMPITPETEGDWTDISNDYEVDDEVPNSGGSKIIGHQQEEVITILASATGPKPFVPETYSAISSSDDSYVTAEFEEEESVEGESDFKEKGIKAMDLLKEWILNDKSYIPFLPISPNGKKWTFGKDTEKIIMDLWYDQREILRRCNCKICERGRISRYGNGYDQPIRGWLQKTFGNFGN